MKAFNAKRALHLARAAALAYSGDADEAGRRLGASAVSGFEQQATFGYTARVGEEVIVAFRGTDPRQVWNWITNFDITQTPAATPSPLPLSPSQGERGRGEGGRTHQGMTRVLDLLWPNLVEQIGKSARPGERVWFTGHSLGGALAALAALRLAEQGREVGAYTFGAPRVGCPTYSAGYRVPLHRVEGVDDLVCHLPPGAALSRVLGPVLTWGLSRVLGGMFAGEAMYCHVGYLTLLDQGGSLVCHDRCGEDPESMAVRFRALAKELLGQGRGSVLEGHSMQTYLDRLNAASKVQ
ncbi:MAG: hypothetical protein L0Z62_05195 [Gemmataceae bacterium]|nr:hypothetical protein [Gemmataceae bacterium]